MKGEMKKEMEEGWNKDMKKRWEKEIEEGTA
jgi:hypothetical protein